MGKLRSLEIENFKSYEGKHIIGPLKDFTCIIGPNGSGKSNVMDAICFVLGIQSKHLRSSTLKDLIFRRDSYKQAARKASVKLIYEMSPEESDELDDQSNKIITFCRVITISGISLYYIDTKEISYEKYETVLNGIGVLVRTRNFLVFQGDIEMVAQKSHADFTKLIEQISGSDELINEYVELSKKYAEVDEAILVAMQKKKMFAIERKEMLQHKNEAAIYSEKSSECDELATELLLWKIWKVKCALEEKQKSHGVIKTSMNALAEEEAAIDESIQEDKAEVGKVSKVVSRQEKTLKVKSKALEGIRSDLMEIEAKIAHLKRREAECKRGEERIKVDCEKQQAALMALKAESEALREEEAMLKSRIGDANELFRRLDAATIEEYSRLREEVAATTASNKTKTEVITRDIKSTELRLAQMEKEKNSIVRELSNSKNIYDSHVSRFDKIRSALENSLSELHSINSERAQVSACLKARDDQLQAAASELADVSARLSSAKDDARRTKQELKELGAIETMQKVFSGVHGKLVDLCNPIQKKYAHAIAVAAGKHMDAIVVDTKQTASDCISYLKDQRIGTFMFLPLDHIKSRPVPERLRNLGPGFHVGFDLLSFDENFRPAVQYAIGSTIICDTLQDAQRLCFERGESVKAVTMRGEVISKSGVMTGGSIGSRATSDRWKDKELDSLRNRKIELEEILSKGNQGERHALIQLESRASSMQSQIELNNAELQVIEQKMGQTKQQISRFEVDLTKLSDQIEAIQTRLVKQTESLDELKVEMETVENRVFNEFSRRLGLSNIRDFEANTLLKTKKIYIRLQEIGERLTDVAAHIDFESRKKFDDTATRLADQLKQIHVDIDKINFEHDSKKQEQEVAIRQISEAEKELHSLSKLRTESESKLKKEVAAKATLLHQKESLTSKMALEEIAAEKLRSQLHDILQQSEIGEVAVPTVEITSSSGESPQETPASQRSSFWNEDLLVWEGPVRTTSSSSSRSGQETNVVEGNSESGSGSHSQQHTSRSASTHFSQSQSSIVRRDARRVLRIDLSAVEKTNCVTEDALNAKIASLESKIAQLKIELQGMTPNLHATERYETVLQKYIEANDEIEELRAKAKDLSHAFGQVKEERLNRFQACFKHVSEMLGVIYRDLTKSTKHPLGGNAFLSVDRADEPYLGGVRFTAMPPMKRFRDMDQLSGGEKTVAALAFLFSVHSFRPAPFFVLDEVDAALDNVNVKKICNYIVRRSKDFQCIVISLKDSFFENADCLVGICRDGKTQASRHLLLDLKKFDGEIVDAKPTKEMETEM